MYNNRGKPESIGVWAEGRGEPGRDIAPRITERLADLRLGLGKELGKVKSKSRVEINSTLSGWPCSASPPAPARNESKRPVAALVKLSTQDVQKRSRRAYESQAALHKRQHERARHDKKTRSLVSAKKDAGVSPADFLFLVLFFGRVKMKASIRFIHLGGIDDRSDRDEVRLFVGLVGPGQVEHEPPLAV